MTLDVRLGQRQEQRLALLPQMLQSIEVLQLATADLLQLVDQELQRNETLELGTVDAAVPSPPERVDRDDTDWDRLGELRRAASDAGDKKLGFLANVPAQSLSLRDHVREQLAFRGVPALLADAVLQLVDRLDERGLLPEPLAALAAELGVPKELLHEARDELQSLDPIGLGARDGIEAMLLQARHDPDLTTIERLLRDHLEDLSRNRLPDVARALQLTLDELQQLLARVRALSPRPAAAFHDDGDGSVRADVRVWVEDGRLCVTLDDGAVPDLSVNADYAELARRRDTERSVRDYLRPKLRSARDLIEAIEQRNSTLVRVVAAVMKEQAPFLQAGRVALRPLRMSEIAERLGLHTSTVSRAIAGKWVQTDRGVFRLRDFFDGGRIDAEANEGQGRLAVAQQIQELVDGEDKRTPLSDDEITAQLLARGVRAARRTVAKYRKELDIPSSYLRRRFGDPT